MELKKHNPGYWEFFVDTEGRLRSPEVEEDLHYLHRRGYCFCETDYSTFPTQRTDNVLEAAGLR